MATDLAKLVVRLEAQTQQYVKNLDKAEKRATRWEKAAKKSASSVGKAFAGIAFGAGLAKIISATREQEAALKQLDQAFKTTGETVGLSTAKVADYAAALQNVTTFGDEEFIKAASQLRSFTSVIDDEFNRALELSADLSERFGTDLKSSVLQLGKALNDPVANLSALSRSGIQFTEVQKDMIKQLVEAGRLQDAQRIILGELDVQFGGSARAARDTFGGALKALGNTTGDLLEADSASLPALAQSINDLNEQFSDPSFVQNIQAVSAAMIGGIGKAASVMADALEVTRFLAEEFAAFTGGAAVGDLPRLEDELAGVNKELAKLYLQAANTGPLDFLFKGGRDSKVAELREEKKAIQERIRLTKELRDMGGSGLSGPPGIGPSENEEVITPGQSFEGAFGDLNARGLGLIDAANDEDDEFAERRKALADLGDEIEKAIATEQEYTDEQQRQADARRAIKEAELDIAGNVFGGLAALMKEGSRAQRVLLAAEKAAAVARSIMSLNVAIGKAAELGFPANIPAIAQATAIGTQAIATIKGVNVAGVAHGGLTNVPSESTFMLDKGERVLSPNQNRDLTNFLKGQGGGVTIINNAPGVRHRQGDSPNEIIAEAVDQAVRAVDGRILRGSSQTSKNISQRFGVSQAAGVRT